MDCLKDRCEEEWISWYKLSFREAGRYDIVVLGFDVLSHAFLASELATVVQNAYLLSEHLLSGQCC